MTHKAIPVAVNGSNFEKSIISKYKRVIYDFKNYINFGLSQNLFFPFSLKTTQNNRNSPHNGPIKKCCNKLMAKTGAVPGFPTMAADTTEYM